jgi:hypothetical protein
MALYKLGTFGEGKEYFKNSRKKHRLNITPRLMKIY